MISGMHTFKNLMYIFNVRHKLKSVTYFLSYKYSIEIDWLNQQLTTLKLPIFIMLLTMHPLKI